MLKRLFTSGTRIKLLNLFLFHPEDEYFIRELTRKLDEQINSIRRELDNLKRAGLLKSKNKNRKKYYIVDKNFVFFNELKGMFAKAQSDAESLTKKLSKAGEMDVLILSGIFADKSSTVDLLLVGNIDKTKLESILNTEVEAEKPVKYSILTKEDFLYRVKFKDRFLQEMLTDPTNIVAINRLELQLQ